MKKFSVLLALTAALAAGASAQTTTKIDSPFRAELGLYIPTFSEGHKDLGVGVGLGYAFYKVNDVEFAGVARGQFYHASQDGLGYDLSLGTYGVDARYRPADKKYFVGVGLAAAQIHAASDDFGTGDTTKLGYSIEAGYDFTKQLYGVVRYQDTTDDSIKLYRGLTVGVGYKF